MKKILFVLRYTCIIIGIALLTHFLTLFISVMMTRHNTTAERVYPYQTDGCTLYIDGDYADCCESHDQAYWRGGPIYKKLLADAELYACIARK